MKPAVAQLGNSPSSMQPKGSVPCSQTPANGPCPDESSPHCYILFLDDSL